MHVQSAVRDLQHSRSDQVADKAKGKAKYFARHKITPREL